MSNLITVNFTPCSPEPTGGYNIQYRELGSTDPYIDAGSFFSSPAMWADTFYPDNTQFEGVIRAVTADGNCDDVAWSTGELPPEIEITFSDKTTCTSGGADMDVVIHSDPATNIEIRFNINGSIDSSIASVHTYVKAECKITTPTGSHDADIFQNWVVTGGTGFPPVFFLSSSVPQVIETDGAGEIHLHTYCNLENGGTVITGSLTATVEGASGGSTLNICAGFSTGG
jgi:hypothetical protein